MVDPANPNRPEAADPRLHPGDDGATSGSDEDRLAAYAAALADGIEAALGPWVVDAVTRIAEAWEPGSSSVLRDAAEDAAAQAAQEVGLRVRELLATDVDEQRTGPLALLREAVRYPTAVLRSAGIPPVARDEFAERAFPADVYDLAPASFADVSPALHEPGLVWGAAKAHVVLARRRAEGRR